MIDRKLPAYITDNDSLNTLCESLHQVPVIGVDTEFIRTRTFFPKLGLIQVSLDNGVYLIDPLTIDQWQPWIDVLASPEIVKIFHACSEDLEVLYHCFGVMPVNVFDTQIAAAFLGYDFSMGYQRLVKTCFDQDIPKESSRTDWLKRPLTDEQLSYAKQDVEFLIPLYLQMQPALTAKFEMDVMAEELQVIQDNVERDDFSEAYQKFGLTWQLDGYQLARLQALAAFREDLMRKLDRPRKHIATNDALLALAKKGQWQVASLYKMEGFSIGLNKTRFDQWLTLLNQDYKPLEPLKRPRKPGSRFRKVKRQLTMLANKHQIAEPLLLKKSWLKVLDQQIMKRPDAPEIEGWRQPFYTKAMALGLNDPTDSS
ncbi:MAG: ribonuclease D [Cellvibrionales bacterium]|nr:ribonuclease D [Cellvibrionales bacterium]